MKRSIRLLVCLAATVPNVATAVTVDVLSSAGVLRSQQTFSDDFLGIAGLGTFDGYALALDDNGQNKVLTYSAAGVQQGSEANVAGTFNGIASLGNAAGYACARHNSG